jgi:hypothetical protein
MNYLSNTNFKIIIYNGNKLKINIDEVHAFYYNFSYIRYFSGIFRFVSTADLCLDFPQSDITSEQNPKNLMILEMRGTIYCRWLWLCHAMN